MERTVRGLLTKTVKIKAGIDVAAAAGEPPFQTEIESLSSEGGGRTKARRVRYRTCVPLADDGNRSLTFAVFRKRRVLHPRRFSLRAPAGADGLIAPRCALPEIEFVLG
jgi:hypothetical protein